MRSPEFIRTTFSQCAHAYDHLDRDDWAALVFNFTVASAESELRPRLDSWYFNLPIWNGDVASNLDPEGDLRTEAPPSWKAAVPYARSVIQAVCDVVVARAESADELSLFSDLLEHLEVNFAAHFFNLHLRTWADDEGLETVFHRFLRNELRSVRAEQVFKAWQKYHARLSESVQAGPGLPSKTVSTAASRASVVLPILAAKRWTPNKWASAAGVGKNCAYEYLAGTRDLSDNNRRAMAEELGLTAEELPNT